MLLAICIWDSYEQQSQDDEKMLKKKIFTNIHRKRDEKIALNEQNLCCEYMCLSLWIVLKNTCSTKLYNMNVCM